MHRAGQAVLAKTCNQVAQGFLYAWGSLANQHQGLYVSADRVPKGAKIPALVAAARNQYYGGFFKAGKRLGHCAHVCALGVVDVIHAPHLPHVLQPVRQAPELGQHLRYKARRAARKQGHCRCGHGVLKVMHSLNRNLVGTHQGATAYGAEVPLHGTCVIKKNSIDLRAGAEKIRRRPCAGADGVKHAHALRVVRV